MRQATSSFQVRLTAMPKGEMSENMAPMKMVIRRPNKRLSGSASQPALDLELASPDEWEET
jgi:hypothetical protein